MTENFTYDEMTVSDLHKDAYGCRPTAGWWSQWKAMTPAEKQEEWNFLCCMMEEAEQAERRAQARNYDAWDGRITRLMQELNISRSTALRWDIDADVTDGDIGYYCYLNGLSFSMEEEIKNILKGEE